MPGEQTVSESWSAFECEASLEPGRAYARPAGELDLATAPILDGRLRELAASRPQELVVDLGGLTFIDSSGLHVLIKWSERAVKDGLELVFLPGPPVVQRVFGLAGVEELLPFVARRPT